MGKVKDRMKYFSLITLVTGVSSYGHGEERNELLAQKLLRALNSKIDNSLSHSTKKPIKTWDENRIAMQCLNDEVEYVQIEKSVLLPFTNLLKDKKLNDVDNYINKTFNINNFISSRFKERNIEGISITAYSLDDKRYEKSKAREILAAYVNNFKAVESLEFVGTHIISLPSQRSDNQNIKSAKIMARIDMRGIGIKENEKVQLRSKLRIDVISTDQGWKISGITFQNTEKLSTNKIFFENISKKSKIATSIPAHLRREAIRRGGYAMALTDYNKDKNLDLFVATVAETVLLDGQENYVYKKVKTKELEERNFVKAAAFADFDNDGSEDLLLVRFAPNESQDGERSDIQIFKGDGKKLVHKKNIVNYKQKTNYAMPLALADFDRDGGLDFYVGFPGAKDFTTLEEAVHEKGVATQGVFFNDGFAKFKDDPYKNFEKVHEKMLEKNGTDDDLARIFPHSAIAVDMDENGTSDLVVIDDRGNLSPIYLNNGKADFAYATKKIGIGLKDYGMGAEITDLNNDGKYDFLMTSVNFNASKRVKDSCELNWSLQDTISAGVKGLRSFTANDNGTFTETTEQNGLDWIGQGAGGVKVIDYNNDGLEDIYVVNGLWTGSEKDQSQDLSSQFVIASTLGILEDGLRSELNNENLVYEHVIKNNDFKSLMFRSGSQSSIMDILSFYRGDIHNGKKINREIAASLAGAQRNMLFHNNGDGTYTEVGYLMGVDSVADGYMIATADLDKDGRMDLFLRNADPGYKEDQFLPVEVFQNKMETSNKSVVLKLVGTKSNRDAVGALLTAKVGDRVIKRQMVGSSGTVQSEKIIHIGLKDKKEIEQLSILWPSGQKQTFKGVKPGYYEITEEVSKPSPLSLSKR